jgi:hypothetical protein
LVTGFGYKIAGIFGYCQAYILPSLVIFQDSEPIFFLPVKATTPMPKKINTIPTAIT